MKRFSWFSGLALCSLLVLAAGNESRAAIQIQVWDGTDWEDVANGTGFEFISGSISAALPGSGWSGTAIAEGRLGPPTSGLTQTNFTLLYNNAGSATLQLRVSADDYTFPLSPPDVVMTTTLSASYSGMQAGGNTAISVQSWVSPGNVLFDTSSGALTAGALTVQNAGSFTGTGSLEPNLTNVVIGQVGSDFSATQYITVTLDQDEELTLTVVQSLSQVPEPASLAAWSILACAGAAGMALRRKRRGRWTKANREAILGVINKT